MGSLLLLILLTLPNVEPSPQGRLRPPENLPCSRDQLTSYSGVPSGYRRSGDLLRMVIRTDENTRESIQLRLKQGEQWEKFFLWSGSEFRPEHWKRLEAAEGKLRPEVRVTAWVCSSGLRPVLDWQQPPE